MSSCRFRWSLVVLVPLVVFAFPLSTIGQEASGERSSSLPKESELPGQIRRTAGSPGEDVLPGEVSRGTGSTGNDTNGQASNSNGRLPGEEELPGREADSVTPVADPLKSSPPILRLAFDGHTGRIRSIKLSEDGDILVTAGEDKDVHIWRRDDVAPSGWLHHRTIRWPVSRGPRGLVHACAIKNRLAAFAGYGAFGSNGEIRIVNVDSGELVATLVDFQNGHRQPIAGLDWSPSEELQLASVDVHGRLMVWSPDPRTGLWRGRTLVDVDRVTYGDAVATALGQSGRRGFVPVRFLDDEHLVVPRYAGAVERAPTFANWHLSRIRHFDLATDVRDGVDHFKHIRDLASSADGSVLATCDYMQHVGIFRAEGGDDGGDVNSKVIQLTALALSIDVNRAGTRLLVGTEKTTASGTSQSQIQIWDIAGDDAEMLSERTLSHHVWDCAFDETENQVIAALDSELHLLPVDLEGKFVDADAAILTAPAKPVRKVAFAKSDDSYRVAYSWQNSQPGNTQFDGVFNLSDSKLEGRGKIVASDFLSEQRTSKRWSYRGPVTTESGPRFQIVEAGVVRGVLPLEMQRHGVPQMVFGFPSSARGNEDPNEALAVGAVIVGTTGQNMIYVYRVDEPGPPRLLRQFRGQSGAVLSVSTSPDGRFLASGSNDATIAIWNLDGLYSQTESINAWGANFLVEGASLIASDVQKDGPLYFKGVRNGDRLASLDYMGDDGELTVLSDPELMQAYLRSPEFDLQVTFKFARQRQLVPAFVSLPAWRPLATLFVDQSREWAFWTPAGYYDASFNGHQRFGWQINGGIDQPVDFFRAAQFRERLERPDVMRNLLKEGNLSDAMGATVAQIGPPPADTAILDQIATRPTIRLVSPRAGTRVDGDTLVVDADIQTALGAVLVRPRAFVSGVPAVQREQVASRQSAEGTVTSFRWTFRLPRDPHLQLEILAATESEAVGRLVVNFEHRATVEAKSDPRLHLIAIGAGRYRDPQIQSLDFAARAVGEVASLFESRASGLYRTSSDRLVDEDAIRPLWRAYAQRAADELAATVQPDDLVVMYLCGHGLRDRRTDDWYFVTSDANFHDLMNDEYADCIAFSDLAVLARLPCRKLAILDSCHSGAVQPVMRQEDLKSALRFLQDDLVLTLTASEGDEEAVEQEESQLGRFTAALLDALRGSARELDDDSETISLQEVIRYVSRRVGEESASDGYPQHPTASPAYLLKTLQIPLTRRP